MEQPILLQANLFFLYGRCYNIGFYRLLSSYSGLAIVKGQWVNSSSTFSQHSINSLTIHFLSQPSRCSLQLLPNPGALIFCKLQMFSVPKDLDGFRPHTYSTKTSGTFSALSRRACLWPLYYFVRLTVTGQSTGSIT